MAKRPAKAEIPPKKNRDTQAPTFPESIKQFINAVDNALSLYWSAYYKNDALRSYGREVTTWELDENFIMQMDEVFERVMQEEIRLEFEVVGEELSKISKLGWNLARRLLHRQYETDNLMKMLNLIDDKIGIQRFAWEPLKIQLQKIMLAPDGGAVESKDVPQGKPPLVDGIKTWMTWKEITFKEGKIEDSVVIHPLGGRAKNYTPGELCMLDKKTGTPSTHWYLFMQFVERGELPQSDMTTPSKISRLNTTLKKAFGLNTKAIELDRQGKAYRLQRRE